MHSTEWSSGVPPSERRHDPHNQPPIPTSPVYNLSDPRQWLTLLLDKGVGAAIAIYLIVKFEAVLNQLVLEQQHTTVIVQELIRAVDRLPH